VAARGIVEEEGGMDELLAGCVIMKSSEGP
jgi:hypothetical protein